MVLNKFELFLLRNSSQIEQVDKYLTLLTTFLPGQTPSMELAGEGIVSASAMLQTYKSHILNKVLEESKRSLESRYLDAQYKEHTEYEILAYLLSALKSTELFIEMSTAHLRGEGGRQRAVIALEALKSALRLRMLRVSQRGLPATVPVHDVAAEPEEIDRLLANQSPNAPRVNQFRSIEPFKDSLKFKTTLLQPPDPDRLRPPLQLMRSLRNPLALSEVLVIMRPLIYATLLYRARKRSWTPWLIGVAMEAVARSLARRTLDRDPKKPTGLEDQVLKSRTQEMVWWLMRGPMYSNHTRVFLLAFANRLLKLPLLSLGGRLLEDALYLFDEYYFASATM